MAPAPRILGRIEEIVAGTFLVLMCAATLANVVARYVFNAPITWAEEFSRYAFIWLVFTGAVVCTKRGKHICIDALVGVLPRPAQLISRVLVDAATAVVMLIMLYYGGRLTASATQSTSTLMVPTYFVYAVVPISAFLILAHSLRDLWASVRAARRAV